MSLVLKEVKKVIRIKKQLMIMFTKKEISEEILKKELGLLRNYKNAIYFKQKTPETKLSGADKLNQIVFAQKTIGIEFPLEKTDMVKIVNLLNEHNVRKIVSLTAENGFFESLLMNGGFQVECLATTPAKISIGLVRQINKKAGLSNRLANRAIADSSDSEDPDDSESSSSSSDDDDDNLENVRGARAKKPLSHEKLVKAFTPALAMKKTPIKKTARLEAILADKPQSADVEKTTHLLETNKVLDNPFVSSGKILSRDLPTLNPDLIYFAINRDYLKNITPAEFINNIKMLAKPGQKILACVDLECKENNAILFNLPIATKPKFIHKYSLVGTHQAFVFFTL